MSEYMIVPTDSIDDTADAIKAKLGSQNDLTWGQDGFASYVEDIPSGGSSYELLGQTNLVVDTTSTTATVIHTFNLPAAWTYQKILYVRVRRTEVPQEGYFYGTDTWFINAGAFNGATAEQTGGLRTIYKVNASQKWGNSTGIAYGVYPRGVSPNGDVAISSRYSSTSSGTINGTFKCEVYLLSWPDNVTPFAPLS